MVVSLWDGSKFRDFIVSCSRASFRDAIPKTLRLPRPLCGLAMTRNRAFLFGKRTVCAEYRYLGLKSERFGSDAGAFVWKTGGLGRMQPFSVRINVSFFRITYELCHCEEGAFLRPTRQSLTERFAIPERNMGKQNDLIDFVLTLVFHIVFLHSVLCSRASFRDTIPQTLRSPRPLCGLAMTRNWAFLFGKRPVLVGC